MENHCIQRCEFQVKIKEMKKHWLEAHQPISEKTT